MPCHPPYQVILSDAGLPYRPTPCAPILISASSNISLISYHREMTCWTSCRLSSQNIPKLTSAHWASPQATGRTNQSGALKAKVNISRWGVYNHPIFSFSITFPISLSSLILTSTSHIFVSVCPRSFRPLAIVLSSELRD